MIKLFNKNKDSSHQEIPTLISKGCVIEGQIKISTTIRIEGNIIGDILNAENLIIGENGLIEGNVQTKEIIIFGVINGNVTADSIQIKGSGKVCGKIKTQNLQVESGAVYNGVLEMENLQ
jgi:cytoskeletal protein CcmA (bactofilin family)